MSAKWVLLPVLGSPLAHAPVLKWDLLTGLKRPVDGGRTFRGRRLFGDNKTLRGAIFMAGGPALAAVALHRSERYRRRLPREIAETSPVVTGTLLGLGVFLGELPNSFLKRQLDIPPGQQRTDPAGIAITLIDQADFTFTSLALLRPVWRWSVRDAAEIVTVATGVHLITNVIGYAIGARKSLL